METRSLLRQIMGYSVPFGFLILLAMAANGDDSATTHPPDKSSAPLVSSPLSATESSQNAATSETIHPSGEHGKNKTSAALEPPSEELAAAAKRPPNATISTTESSPGEKPRAKPGQAEGEGEMRAPPKSVERNSTQTPGNRGCGAGCRTSTTASAAFCGSGDLTVSLGIIMAVVFSLLLSF